ncbi:MAG: permease [Gammaproteobacteria bacterium]|nr:permease [Gammaproteobacteria bacterium]
MILLASIVALLLGPLLFNLTIKNPKMLDLFDGFIFVVIGGLVIFHILPETIEQAGLLSILFVLFGLFGPSVAESLFHKAAALTHKTTLALGVFGLVLHSITDGTALTQDPNFTQLTLIIAVIAHRLPVGLTVWWLLRPHFGKVIALSVLGLMAGGTMLGSYYGSQWVPNLDQNLVALMESFIAGSVLHVVFHRPYAEHHHSHQKSTTHYDGIGSLLGLGCLIAILMTGHQDHEEHANHQLDLLVQLAFTLAPFLLIAYALSSVSKYIFSDNLPIDIKSTTPTKFQILRGALLGLPLPFCIPDATKAYQLLRKQGAHASLALAFLLSAPILGFESLLISLPLLGWEMTLIRLVGAVAIIIVLAFIMVRWVKNSAPAPLEKQTDIANKLRHALHHGYEHLLDHTAPWIFVGLILASLLTFGHHQPQWYDLFIIAAIAMPFRLCATGITPLAAALIVSGWSPGSALVLLLLGPTVSLELVRFMLKEHGPKLVSAFVVLLPISVISLAALVDSVFGASIVNMLQITHSAPSVIEGVSLAIILTLVSWSLLRRGARAFVSELLPKLQLFSHNHHH